jgi:predicted DNA repair protein MutK
MAFSLLTLLDDVVSVMDDVAIMTKVAAKKTSGVIGDDLALNAQQLNGIDPNQELPIVLAVAKGSFVNKLILVPIALLISAFFPFLVTPLLMIGGAFLCFEGVEKILEKIFHKKENSEAKEISREDRIKGAVKTDFILSAEIIVIALGTMAAYPIFKQVIALSLIGIAMNVGVYGFVALIIKIDDFGFMLQKQANKALIFFGRFLIFTAPILMKFLGIAGTTAMFLVGGGIITHGVHFISEMINIVANNIIEPFRTLTSMAGDLIIGLLTGLVIVAILNIYKRIRNNI